MMSAVLSLTIRCQNDKITETQFESHHAIFLSFYHAFSPIILPLFNHGRTAETKFGKRASLFF